MQHTDFLTESQVVSIQPFPCWSLFVNASASRRVLNMKPSAQMIAKQVCYLTGKGFKEMGPTIFGQC